MLYNPGQKTQSEDGRDVGSQLNKNLNTAEPIKNNTFSFESIKESELPEMYRLYCLSNQRNAELSTVQELSFELFKESMMNEYLISKKIIIDTKTVGIVSFFEDEGVIVLDGIYIHPDFQSKKIGTHLLNSLIEKADSLNKKVTLEINKNNIKLKKFYESLGFNQVSASRSLITMEYVPQSDSES